MEGTFSNKWGIQKEELVTYKVQTTALVQFIVIAAILCLMRPKFVMNRRVSTKIAELSIPRVVLASALVVSLTYIYPQCS